MLKAASESDMSCGRIAPVSTTVLFTSPVTGEEEKNKREGGREGGRKGGRRSWFVGVGFPQVKTKRKHLTFGGSDELRRFDHGVRAVSHHELGRAQPPNGLNQSLMKMPHENFLVALTIHTKSSFNDSFTTGYGG